MLTPRYDYRVKDELAWDAATKDFYAREESFARQANAALAEVEKDRNTEIHAQWLATEVVPFYEDWSRRIAELELAPDRATARQRDALLRILRLQLENYRRLIADLRAHDAGAIPRYLQDEAKVTEEINRLNKP